MGFAATPDAVQTALRTSSAETIANAFSEAAPMAMPEALASFQATAHESYRKIYRGLTDREAKRMARNELRQRDNQLFSDYALAWFHHARKPENSATEKLVLFLQDVFVVDRQVVRDAPALFSMQALLREGCRMEYPELCKRVSREPAMIRYLNLDKSTAQKPNENFAREFFELFSLGEGQYSEQDVKEAARAFTGYRARNRYEFFLNKRLHDSGKKTIFGKTGNWDGDAVVDLTFEQPAARTFLIRELIRFYLTVAEVPEPYLVALGEQWAARDFDLPYLIETFFQSRLFYHPAYRGNLVKSPIQFYLGLCQELHLDVLPLEGRLLQSMSVMGQSFYSPPNVRGWLYGEHWINSTTISARRQLVDFLFSPLNEDRLNANDRRDLQRAREEGRAEFLVTEERLAGILDIEPAAIARHLTTYFITPPFRNTYKPVIEDLIAEAGNPQKAVRNTIIALLQSPAYNLC